MRLFWTKPHLNAAAIAGGMSVSFTRLAVWRVAILHLASIIPTVKVLKYVNSQSSRMSWEFRLETHPASSVKVSHSGTRSIRVRVRALEID